ncbi:hypothetical protein ACIRL3_25900 [Streptomyces sp. NPDC102384]|uniref:hypothetical protein n=1 Tax=Streptomyces sp. NPDC102384 TaxID=3366166 RepID=UPI00380339A3
MEALPGVTCRFSVPETRGATTPSGMLNWIGIQGEGVDTLLDQHLPWLCEQGARTVVSIAGHSIDEYAEVAAQIAAHPAGFIHE